MAMSAKERQQKRRKKIVDVGFVKVFISKKDLIKHKTFFDKLEKLK